MINQYPDVILKFKSNAISPYLNNIKVYQERLYIVDNDQVEDLQNIAYRIDVLKNKYSS